MKYGVTILGTSLVLIGFVAAADGCTNVDDFRPTGSSDDGGGTPPGDSGRAVTDPDGAARGGDGGDGGAPTKGYVIVGLSQDTQEGKTAVSASLYSGLYAGATRPLADDRDGLCRVTVRPIVPPTDAGPEDERAAVGTVVVRGGALPPAGLTLLPSNTTNNPVTVAGNVWLGGDAFTVEASGGAIPGFAGKVVLAPSDVQVRAPLASLQDGGAEKIIVNRKEPLAVRWTGGGVGNVQVFLTSRDNVRQRRTQIFCEFPARDGKGSISAKLLEYLDKGSDEPGVTGTGSFTIIPDSAVQFVSGEWTVILDLSGTIQSSIVEAY